MEILLETLQYGFMQRSLIMAIIVGIVCAVVGSYLMVQRLALLGIILGRCTMSFPICLGIEG